LTPASIKSYINIGQYVYAGIQAQEQHHSMTTLNLI